MKFKDIYTDVVSSFGQLWSFKERENSLEIITPFATTSQKFVSVFLTKRDTEFVVTDGGWIAEGLYDNHFSREVYCFDKAFAYYQDSFNIKQTANLSGGLVFYKKTDKKISIPSLVFDMANFISTIVSLSSVEYGDKELEEQHNFSRKARLYLEKHHPKRDWYFNDYLDSTKVVKPSAILRKKNYQVVLFNFITGSTYTYFRSNISKANIVFELAEEVPEKQYIDNKVALLDNRAKGYSTEHVSIWLNHFIRQTKATKLEWTKLRNELPKVLKKAA